MPTPFERIAALLTRDGANYRCPAHDDTHGSLSVSVGRNGGVVVHCHAGCTTRDVLTAIGLTERDLFASTGATRPAAADHASIAARADAALADAHAPRRVVARYPYTDESGTLRYRTIRTEPKGFWQERADGAPSLTGICRVLYRLPETIEAVALGKLIHFTEGEKDADALAALGLTATTIAGGANAELTAEMVEVLRGASIVIHADNDASGRECAETRAAALNGTAASVRVIHYAELPEKGDVTDFLTEHTPDELQARVDAAPLWEPSAEADGPQVWTLAELLNNPELLTPPPAIIANVAYAGRLTLFAAREKAGKSTFIGAAAAAISRGAMFLGAQVPAQPILHVGLEEPLGDIVRRYATFGADPAGVDIVSSLPNGAADLRAILAWREYGTVVFDTLAAYMAALGVADFNAAAQVLPIVNELAALAHESGAAIVLLHHASKGTGRYRDSTALGGAVDVIVEMLDPEDAGNPTRRDFRTRGRMPTNDFSVTFADGAYTLANSGESLEMRVLDAIRTATANGGTLSKSAVRSAIRGAVGKIDAALRSLAERGLVIFERGAGYSVPTFTPSANGPEW